MSIRWRMVNLKMKANGKRMRRLAAGMAAASLFLAAGCSVVPKEEAELKPPLVKPAKEKLELREVKKGVIAKNMIGSATFTAASTQSLQFRVSGARFSAFLVSSGEAVKKGQLLAQVDMGDLPMQLKMEELNVEKAEIYLNQARAAKADADTIRLKSIDLEMVRMKRDALKRQLGEMELRADRDGVVTYLAELRQGDMIQPFVTVASVADPKDVQLRYEAGESTDLTGVEVQMAAVLTYRGKTYEGKVVQTPSTAPSTPNLEQAGKDAKTIVLEAKGLPNTASIGESVDFTITLQKHENALLIPRAALRSYLGRDYVQVLDGESRKEADVQKGIVTSTEVEILDGLKEGQQVILQ